MIPVYWIRTADEPWIKEGKPPMATTTLKPSQNGIVHSATADEKPAIEIPAIDVQHLRVRLVGDSPLISHKWSEKAKKQMLSKQMKEAKQAKEAKNPEQDYLDSLYEHPDGGYGFPCVAFKAAAVGACRFADMKMTEARGAFHVNGELAQIEGLPTPREDMVRVGMGTADIRYRGEFREWSTELDISYNASSISPAQIVNLLNLAGFGVGVGEWRPEKDGPYGRFHVETKTENG